MNSLLPISQQRGDDLLSPAKQPIVDNPLRNLYSTFLFATAPLVIHQSTRQDIAILITLQTPTIQSRIMTSGNTQELTRELRVFRHRSFHLLAVIIK